MQHLLCASCKGAVRTMRAQGSMRVVRAQHGEAREWVPLVQDPHSPNPDPNPNPNPSLPLSIVLMYLNPDPNPNPNAKAWTLSWWTSASP